jgi:hypothetical protein
VGQVTRAGERNIRTVEAAAEVVRVPVEVLSMQARGTVIYPAMDDDEHQAILQVQRGFRGSWRTLL